MASDLIAYHYRHSAPSHILYEPLEKVSGSSGSDSSTTLFTLFEGEHDQTPSNVRRNWLIVDPANSHPNPADKMDLVLDKIGPGGLTINSYDKRIVTWAVQARTDNLSRDIKIDMLYEMKLEIPSKDPNTSSFQGYSTPALVALENKGFDIEEDPDWFCVFKPEEKSIITLGRERVFTVSERATGEKAAFITVLPDPEGSERVYVSSLETFPRWRMRGLARALMEHVHVLHAHGRLTVGEERLAGGEEGIREMWLTVFCENIGPVGMYHRFGYRVNRCLWVVNL